MLEFNLASYSESLADPAAPDYERLRQALNKNTDPDKAGLLLYHQWQTYHALKDTPIVVNSYNTGTGKTYAALLHLLDLNARFGKQTRDKRSNVLFIAPTNELLRQHEDDVAEFIKRNNLQHLVLRLDANRIKELGIEYLPDKNVRQSDRLQNMLEDPGKVLIEADGFHPENNRPFVLITNPDIFYYALYMRYGQHEKRLLFKTFLENFGCIIVDEFHYYNSKQLANFMFFLTLGREWGYFEREERRICLLTATPVPQVKDYLKNLELQIAYIEPGSEPMGLERTPALAPVRLQLHSAESLAEGDNADGLVALAGRERATVLNWLQADRHGLIVSSALWRINELYRKYKGQLDERIGRITGAENSQGRLDSSHKALIMATPTVDIGYNFGRSDKARQSLDFALFDASTSDEFIQRLGRAARVLGRPVADQPSDVWAVVPDKLVTALQHLAGQTIERPALNEAVKEALPPRNGLYTYIRSGAIGEAFYPLYAFKQSLETGEEEQVERLFEALKKVYAGGEKLSYKRLKFNIRRYLKLQASIKKLEKEAESEGDFEFSLATLQASILYDHADYNPDDLSKFSEEDAQSSKNYFNSSRKREELRQKRLKTIEEFYAADARFHFRDNFQPPQVLVYDPGHLLSSGDYTVYSAMHLLQNYEGDWSNDQKRLSEWNERCQLQAADLPFTFLLTGSRTQRLRLYFTLDEVEHKEWEERYVGIFTARRGFRLQSEDGPIPAEINDLFERQYLTFYAVPQTGSQARALAGLSRFTSLYKNYLRVEFNRGNLEDYWILLGSTALQVQYERTLVGAKYVAEKTLARHNHIFDWDY